jgi:hypothetical protein
MELAQNAGGKLHGAERGSAFGWTELKAFIDSGPLLNIAVAIIMAINLLFSNYYRVQPSILLLIRL